jgi:hypothetical protein
MLITAVVVFIVMVTGLALIAKEFIDETNEKKRKLSSINNAHFNIR